jgi:DNA-directed RNA polymerase specialized sigma24 family protein
MSPSQGISDEALVRRCLAGQNDAAEQLFERCKSWLELYVRPLLVRKNCPLAWADDITTNTLEAMVDKNYRRLRRFNSNRGSFRGFLAAITNDQLNQFLRNRCRSKKSILPLDRCPEEYLQVSDANLEAMLGEIAGQLPPALRMHLITCLTVSDEKVLRARSRTSIWKNNQRLRQFIRVYSGFDLVAPVSKAAGQGSRTKLVAPEPLV